MVTNRVTTQFENKVNGRGLEDYIDNLETAESKTKAVARAMSAMADDVVNESKRSEAAVSKLSQALGPEFVKNSARGEQGIRDVITQLRNMGAEFDDIEANVDELAASLRKVDEAGATLDGPKKAAGEAAGEVGRLSDSARGANSALANMVGNSAQDIGQLGGLAGSAGVAIGQMAEYASDATLAGEGLTSALKSMALVAGPIAALTIGVQLLNVLMKHGDEDAKRIAESTQKYADALINASDAGDDLATALDKQVRADVDSFLKGLGGKTDDVTAAFDSLGITYDDVVQAFKTGDGPLVDAFDRFGQIDERLRRELDPDMVTHQKLIEEQARKWGVSTAEAERQISTLRMLDGAFANNAAMSVTAIENAKLLTDWRTRDNDATANLTVRAGELDRALDSANRTTETSISVAEQMAAADEQAAASAQIRKNAIDAVRQAEERRLSTFLRTVGGDIGIRAAQSDALAAFNDPNASFDQKLQSILGAANQIAAIRQTELESRGNRVDANVQAQLLKDALGSFATTFGQIFLGDSGTLALGDALADALRRYITDISAQQAGQAPIPFRGSYATGTSRVPGAEGAPGWAIVHGGEQITSVGGSTSSDTTISIPVTVNAGIGTDGHQVGRQIVEAIDSAIRGGQQFAPFTVRAIRGR